MQDLLISLSPSHIPKYVVEWRNRRTRRKFRDDEMNIIGNRPRLGRIMLRGNYSCRRQVTPLFGLCDDRD
jgi:hypothetical protein